MSRYITTQINKHTKALIKRQKKNKVEKQRTTYKITQTERKRQTARQTHTKRGERHTQRTTHTLTLCDMM